MGTLDRRAMQTALPAYDIGREIGRGAFGIVHAAHHRQLERDVAIKQLPRALAADPGVRERFLVEARTVAALAHPNIVPVHDFVEAGGLHLLIMELLPGGTLGDRLAAGPLPERDIVALIVPVLDALAYAHERGVVHRDVKPDNVLLAADGTPKLSDFGIARIVGGSSARTADGSVVGTPAYVAPEVALGTEAGPAADVWAAGVVLYEALAGRPPHDRLDSPTATLVRIAHDPPFPLADVAPGLDARLATIVMGALAADPAGRPGAAAVAADLRRWAADQTGAHAAAAVAPSVAPAVSPPPGAAGPRHAPAARPRWPWVAAAAAALVLGGIGVVIASGDDAEGDASRVAISTPSDSAAAATSPPDGSDEVADSAVTSDSVASDDTVASSDSVASDDTVAIDDTAVSDGPDEAIDAGAQRPEATTAQSGDASTGDTTDGSVPLASEFVEVATQFQEGCEERDFLPSQCECMILSLTEEFGARRFIIVATQLSLGEPIRADAQAVIAACLLES